MKVKSAIVNSRDEIKSAFEQSKANVSLSGVQDFSPLLEIDFIYHKVTQIFDSTTCGDFISYGISKREIAGILLRINPAYSHFEMRCLCTFIKTEVNHLKLKWIYLKKVIQNNPKKH